MKNNIVAIFDYIDETHTLLHQTVRFRPKVFIQRRPLPNGAFIFGISAGEYRQGLDGNYYHKKATDRPHTRYTHFEALARHVPYRLPRVLEHDTILFLEGEKDVHTCEHLGKVATTCAGGANNFPIDVIPLFTGKHICIIADNDIGGWRGAEKKAYLLTPVAASIKVIYKLPIDKEGGDMSDWVAEHPGRSVSSLTHELDALIDSTPYWSNDMLKFWTPPKKRTHTPTKKKKCTTPIDTLLEKLYGVTHDRDNHWQARCPAHDDNVQSLSITKKPDKILMRCFSGCNNDTILQTLDLTWAHLR